MKQVNRCYSLQSLCRLFGYSRQAFYKQQRLQLLQQSEDGLILQQVMNIRKEQPRCGTRKIISDAPTIFFIRTIYSSAGTGSFIYYQKTNC